MKWSITAYVSIATLALLLQSISASDLEPDSGCPDGKVCCICDAAGPDGRHYMEPPRCFHHTDCVAKHDRVCIYYDDCSMA